MEKYLIAHAAMLDEVRGFRPLRKPGPRQQAMLELLEVIEDGPRVGLDAASVIEELVAHYKKWKYGVGQRDPLGTEFNAGEQGPFSTWPFVDLDPPQTAEARPSPPSVPSELALPIDKTK